MTTFFVYSIATLALALFAVMSALPMLTASRPTTIVREVTAEDRVISILPAPMPERSRAALVKQPVTISAGTLPVDPTEKEAA